MISERLLRKWRKESLLDQIKDIDETQLTPAGKMQYKRIMELDSRILRMTQELLDRHLLRRGGLSEI